MRDGCSHPPGFPIRISPDHSLLAAPRSFSQLTTSFIACLRQGIHTHALSSLTIKSTSHTCRRYFFRAYLKLVFSMPVNIQLSKIEESFSFQLPAFRAGGSKLTFGGPGWNRTTDLTLIRGAL